VLKLKFPMTSIAVLLLAGCAAGPDYVAPTVDAGEGWAQPSAADESLPELSEWWTAFEDPTLNRLVAQARSNNPELRQAVARVAQARALRDATAGGQYPAVDLGASVTERRQSENGPLPIGQIPGLERDQTIFETGFDAAWEVDLFGRNRRLVEAAEARLGEAVEQSHVARLTVTAEVARVYLTLRGLQRERAARESALGLSRQTAALTRRQFELGEVAEARVAQAEAEVASLEAELPLLDAETRSQALALGVLLGELPEAELALLQESTEHPSLSQLPVGERADLLRRRPDVRAAEWRLAAATAEVGVATAELFPRLSIGAAGSFQALNASDLFESESETWSLVPLVSWRIFDGGSIRARIRANEAGAEAAALAYEGAVLAALLDAERALSRYHYDLLALEQQRVAVAAARRSHELAQLRYRAGDIALLDLLDAERGLRNAETAYTRMHRVAETDLVALFKALGGGWESLSR
jgi:NodT family efflux transporter outer membrane factor (OMF) lipoprotein